MALRILVLDAYPRDGREALLGAGGTEAGTLYRSLLKSVEPEMTVDVCYPADGDVALPGGAAPADYDGWTWTGSSLTMWRHDDPRIRRQVDLARSGYRRGIPQFGSCWAAQLAAVAAGGRVEENPRGREFGFARGVELNEVGRSHPMFSGKPTCFDAYTSHADIVAHLPVGAVLLASNPFTAVQALAVEHERGTFWAVQYHPEYDLHEIAALARLRRDELVAQGHFDSLQEASDWIEAAERLHLDPSDTVARSRIGAGKEVTSHAIATCELRNWLEHQVRPSASRS